MNEAWHAANRLPPAADGEMRLRWHAEHLLECGCEPMPADLVDEARLRGWL